MTELPPPSTAPAGWYPSPDGRGELYFDGTRWHRLPGFDEPGPHPVLPAWVAVGALAVLTLSLLGSRALVDSLLDQDWPVGVYIALTALAGYGPSVGWALLLRRRLRLTWSDLGVSGRWIDLAWGPVTWIGAIAVQLGLGVLVLLFDIPITSNVSDIDGFDADPVYVIGTAFTAVIVAPIVEELIFRGVVLRGLASLMPGVLAVVAQGVLFGLAHVDPSRGEGNIGLVLVLSGVGCAFGAAAFWFRRTGPTIVAHAIFNAVVLTVVLTGLAERLQDQSPLSGVVAALTALGDVSG